MPGNLVAFKLQNRVCHCLVPEGKPARLFVLCGWETEKLMPVLSEAMPGALFFASEIDGGKDFTPWEAEPIRQGEPFSGGGKDYLKFITNVALPYLEENFDAPAGPKNRVILGYSLGGLFSLWALTQAEQFGAGASISGSLWYPEFLKYLENCSAPQDKIVYLSLGDREPLGGPPIMRTVGDCTEKAKEFFAAHGCEVFFEWNQGGHGKGVTKRWLRAVTRLSLMMDKQKNLQVLI